uniref:Reverse transcriptase zinc-binding domain-containing protein n=1 Tax=Arundo donax TaxID=35708 RepID=A0A0A9CMM6_ARUDO
MHIFKAKLPKWQGDPSCYFCSQPEAVDHLLFGCSVAKVVWGCYLYALELGIELLTLNNSGLGLKQPYLGWGGVGWGRKGSYCKKDYVCAQCVWHGCNSFYGQYAILDLVFVVSPTLPQVLCLEAR